MYKSFKINKRLSFAINRFPKSAKNICLPSKAYSTGFRVWGDMEHKAYAIVIGTFRVMLYIDNPKYGESQG
jgi:hypothetical protein